MKSLGWLTGCVLALACAHEGKGVVGDWGSVISDVMARQAPPGLLGIHVKPEVLSVEIRAAFKSLRPADAKVAGR